MYADNPLCFAVLNILQDANCSYSLYDLMKRLENDGYVLCPESDIENTELLLFRKNFVVMNALYQIQKDVSESGYFLYISSLKIEFLNRSQKNHQLSGNISPADYDLQHDIELSRYYLNWDNYHSADEQAVEALFNSFWNSYAEHNHIQKVQDKRLDSLHLLGVESTASWENIQQAYRRLATVCHPDKGGNSLQFIKIREAYLILKLIKNKSQ